MSPQEQFANVAVAGPMRRTFTYRVGDGSSLLEPGQRLLVPFGRTRKVGYYLGSAEPPPRIEIKPIIRPLDPQSYFSLELFRLCLWIADYYFANPADCLAAALPPSLKKNRISTMVWGTGDISHLPLQFQAKAKPGKRIPTDTLKSLLADRALWRQLQDRGVVVEEWHDNAATLKRRSVGYRLLDGASLSVVFGDEPADQLRFDSVCTRKELRQSGWSDHYIRRALAASILEPVLETPRRTVLDFVKPKADVVNIALTTEQRVALDSLTQALDSGFGVSLLHGITGSGKTLVYCHLANEVLQRGYTVLVLTPEISLTGATLAYFRGFFGDQVTVIHSAMTEKERLQSWQGVRRGDYRIAIGPRSALFAPLPNLGLVIVDEEHDSSYKQDDPSPRFHGRDSAIMRAKLNNIPVLLGSASPSVESYYHARTGRYKLLTLTQRPGVSKLPQVRVVDMRTEGAKGDLPFVSLPLKNETDKRLVQGEQIIFYLNRRGYAPQIKCNDCGHVPLCPHCKVHLTFHKTHRRLLCHYCEYMRSQYDSCEKCSSSRFLYPGTGTQKVEEAIGRLFPKALTVRLDSDSASGRHSIYHILADFAHRKQNLLLGTQMVTKGLDLPGVTLVGVLSADQGMDLPDFRASEKTFARLLQVAGRSGRADQPGEVLIQTYSPDNPIIDDAARQDYVSFYEREIETRKDASYPPFVRLVNIILSAANESKLESAARDFAERLRANVTTAKIQASLLGPAPCPMYHLRKRYRRHLMLKTNQTVKLVQLLSAWEAREPRFKLPATIKIVIDVDPDDMM
ncbi:MAG: primosomal protein N' [Candidatus Zixiibacteriota bacterium]